MVRGSMWITVAPQGMEIHPRLQPAPLLELIATAIVRSYTRRLGSKLVKLISGKLSDSRVMLA